jgi:putative restriction endonuclease
VATVLLTKYVALFEKLHRNKTKAKGAAPHKPILLLAILHEIEAGRISSNLVPLTPELVATFKALWNTLVPVDSGWNPRITYPFRYLQQDGLWELIKNDKAVTIQTALEPTLNQLISLCDGGRFPSELWGLLSDSFARSALNTHLLSFYFSGSETGIIEDQINDYLMAQADKLKAQAQAKFRAKKIVETTEEYFVRNRLFPKVIKELYSYSCCVCDISASIENSSVIDAAHILPFYEFHNDDPRNGLALCKNHHWGFDIGAWSLTDEYTIVVAPKLKNDLVFIEHGKPIAMPKDKSCIPIPTALQWHRENILKAG